MRNLAHIALKTTDLTGCWASEVGQTERLESAFQNVCF